MHTNWTCGLISVVVFSKKAREEKIKMASVGKRFREEYWVVMCAFNGGTSVGCNVCVRVCIKYL